MFYKIKKDTIDKIEILNVQKGMLYTKIMQQYKPDYLINLALYDTNSGLNITKMKVNGDDSGYLFSDYGLCFDNLIDFKKVEKSDDNFVAGSPTLIKDKKSFIDWGNKYSSYIDGTHKRSCIGFNDDSVFLYNSDESLSLNNTIKECLELGMTHAINLDGGGSCHLQQGDEIKNRSVRSNTSWAMIFLKQKETYYGLKVHSFIKKEDAQIIQNKLKDQHNCYSEIYSFSLNGATLYGVNVLSFKNESDAKRIQDILTNEYSCYSAMYSFIK